MAKHPHKLILVDKKTWKCILDGCNFFVHIGLANILPGKQAICWKCGDVFRLDERSLKEEMPKCADCRPFNIAAEPEPDQVEVTEVTDEEESSRQFDISMTKLYGTKDWKKYLK